MFVNPLSDINQGLIDVSGKFFRARVVDNDDPDRMGRIRARVAMLHRNINDVDLPWAVPLNAGSTGSTDAQVSSLVIPPNGGYVWYSLMDNSLYYPVYMGMTAVRGAVHADLQQSYPHSYGHVDRSGNLMLVDTERDQIKWAHVSGAQITIDGAGRVLIQTADEAVGDNATADNPAGITVEVQGTAAIYATDDAVVHAAGNVDVQAAGDVTVNSGRLVQTGAGGVHIDGSRTFINSGSASGGSPRVPAPPAARQRPDDTPFDGEGAF